MKIGILTYYNSEDNYGQILQCFALQKYLMSIGHSAKLIRYNPSALQPSLFYRILLNISPSYLKKTFGQRFDFFFHNSKTSEIEDALKKENEVLNKERQFDAFKKNYIKQSVDIFTSFEELSTIANEYDLFITGSDQVWHDPLYDNNVKGWFLQFNDSKAKRISYAASIGRQYLWFEKLLFKRFLKRLDGVSVRENDTLNMCKKLGFRDAVVSVDPTMLLPKDTYLEIAKPSYINTEPFILLYLINVSQKESFRGDDIIDFAYKNQLSVKTIVSSGYLQARQIFPNISNIMATIPEWVNYIYNAEVVFTTSFHGVVFSILFHKSFYYFPLKGSHSSGNTRVQSLLSKLNLLDRCIYDDSCGFSINNDIDWNYVDDVLNDSIKISKEYLSAYVK